MNVVAFPRVVTTLGIHLKTEHKLEATLMAIMTLMAILMVALMRSNESWIG
jgi:hypothetical protein